jgi:hypothetical protein
LRAFSLTCSWLDGWQLGYQTQRNCQALKLEWIVAAHRGDGQRFVVRSDDKLTAFLELESAIRACREFVLTGWRDFSTLDVRRI